MKSSSTITKNTAESYHQKHRSLKPQAPQEKLQQATSPKSNTSDTRVDLSDQAKELLKQSTTPQSLATSAASHLITGTINSLIPSIISTSSNEVDDEKKNEKEIVGKMDAVEREKPDLAPVMRTEKILTPLPNQSKAPGIFFIKGFESISISTDYSGLDKMADNIQGARLYSWDQKESIINEIKKRDLSAPIVLIGHSLGGDTAVEIANELNSIDNNFRRVDLLVTLDSVGKNNDIVPQNVKNNLNFFGENSWFFNDGPNVARNNELTNVVNELRSEGHTELDNNNDIQFKILTAMQDIL